MLGVLSALCHLLHCYQQWLQYQSLPGNKREVDILRHSGAQIVHMDIKSVNVLLQDRSNRVAKIADLGISKYLIKGSLLDYTYRGMSLGLYVSALWPYYEQGAQCMPRPGVKFLR